MSEARELAAALRAKVDGAERVIDSDLLRTIAEVLEREADASEALAYLTRHRDCTCIGDAKARLGSNQ